MVLSPASRSRVVAVAGSLRRRGAGRAVIPREPEEAVAPIRARIEKLRAEVLLALASAGVSCEKAHAARARAEEGRARSVALRERALRWRAGE